ncbi:MAG: hypothetical protein HRU50_10470 [Winogradskyella sp.]|uniref:GEVED domain-containing protein n=1 Tax=Winogradskyella sp. TaxID=1883156 RepID=UPI0025D2F971|nr:GEVED domain-containing protein [Winogradskyella sp.]NRB60344.1 hypothetical protein [Winogradskyella sp.]
MDNPKCCPTQRTLLCCISNSKGIALILFSFLFSIVSHAQLPITDDFESGWGNWIDGGNDSRRPNSTLLNGNRHLMLRDDSNSSIATTVSLDLTSYSDVTVAFIYRTQSFDNGERYELQYSDDDGTSYATIAQFRRGTEFASNNTQYSTSITIDTESYSFSANARFRLRSFGEEDSERVRIDDITISGTSSSGYCDTVSFYWDVEPITNVSFNTINNTSSNNVGGQNIEDFTTSVSPTTVYQSSTYSISLQGNTVGPYFNYFTVFVDWNQNSVLDDSGEIYYLGSIFDSDGIDGQIATSTIAIPADALLGDTRMRIIKNYNSWATNPCGFYGYGQAEDYTITVSGPIECTTPINAPTNLITSADSNTINGSFNAEATADSYLVIYSTNSTLPGNPTDNQAYNIGDEIEPNYIVADNDTDTNFTISGLLPTTQYYIYVYAMNSNCVNGPLYYTSPLTGDETTDTISYCIPQSLADESDLYIDNIEFIGTLNDVQNLNTGYSSTSGSVGYQDWTSLPNSVQAQGYGINVSWESGVDRGRFKAWVDWNQDGVFDDSSELVYDTDGIGLSSSTFGIQVPNTQAPGDYRLRLKFYHYNSNYYNADSQPCDDFTGWGDDRYGETEDYEFTVISACDALVTSVTEGEHCNETDGDVQVDISVTGNTGVTEFRWYDDKLGGNLVATTVADASFSSTYSPNLTESTFFYVTAFNGSCESLYRTRVGATVNQSSELTFSPSSVEACGDNDTIEVNVTGFDETVYLIEENFEAGLGSFSLNNIVSNGATENEATEWQLESSTYIPSLQVWYPAVSSGITGDQFVMATSDYGSSNPVETAIESSSVSTVDMSNLTLNYEIYFSRYFASIDEFVHIDVTTDGGASWTTVFTHSDDAGYGTAFEAQTLDLSSYVGESNFKVRFRYDASDWCDGVAIDNIELFGERSVNSSFVWDDGGNNFVEFYVDADATIPYVYPDFTDTVYIKLTEDGYEQTVINVDITADLTNGCTIVQTVPITNNTKIWKGTATSTDWFDPNNWSPVGVPDADTCVVIPDAGVQPNPTIDEGTDAFAYSLFVKDDGVLNLDSDQTLTVTNEVVIETGGEFTIDSGGSLVQINDVANTGSLEIDRDTNIRQNDYVFWSAPVAGFDVSQISPNTPSWFIYEWNPTFDWPDGEGPNDYGRWESASGSMNQGKGYIVRGPNGHSSTPSNYTATFDGTPNNGNIIVPIKRGTYTGAPYTGPGSTDVTANSDNWNLLGNPYPSSISITDFLTDPDNANIDGMVQLWTHGTEISAANQDPFYANYQYNYSVADYLIYNASGGSAPLGFDGFIGSGQGFFVRMNDDASTTETITFKNSMRSNTYNNNQFFRDTSQEGRNSSQSIDDNEPHRIWLDLITPSGSTNTTLVAYINGATEGKDRMFDATMNGGNGLNLYSMINDEQFIIQGRSVPFDNTDIVPLGVNILEVGVHTIAINTVEGILNEVSQDVFVEDLHTGLIHNIKNSPFVFTATETGRVNDRFILRYTNQTLSVNDSEYIDAIKVFESNEKLVVKSEREEIQSVRIYDVLGRLVTSNTQLDSRKVIMSELPKNNTALFIEVTLKNSITGNIKVIF